MALELTPLATLPPAVEKAAGAKVPGALKMMAARGLSPLKPAELVVALYQLSFDEDPAVTAAALKSALETPERILAGALAEPSDPMVLDFFARRVWQKPKLLEVVLFNKATHDETFRHLATLCEEAGLELVAKNEERLLRHPPIIAALYLNPKTRMSTAQRALELAVRNGVKVEGVAAFDEAVKAIEQSGTPSEEEREKEDAAFRRAAEVVAQGAPLLVVEVDEEEQQALEAKAAAEADALASEALPEGAQVEVVEERKKLLTELSPAAQIRAATLGNSFARAVLIRSKNKQVSMACIKSPGVSDAEVIIYASNRALDDEIIRYIASKRQWLRHYGIKVALCNNPKCPLPTAMGFLSHLRAPELKALARSKGIPAALATAAKQLIQTRSQGG